jgi:flavin reductase (DIM6/NTAB) family NADH-FMN oxidoreductase RutF
MTTVSVPGPLRAAELRRAFGCFPSGVVGLCALVDAVPVGMAASSFTSVSLDPALVSVCVAKTSTTWPQLRDRARIGVSVLAADHEDACRSLAAKEGDRFAGLGWFAREHGSVFLDGAVARLDCSVVEHLPAGDHDIVLLQIHELDYETDAAPLVFHRSGFRRLVAG